MKTDGLDIPSAFSVNKIKLEVSLVFVLLWLLFVVLSVFISSANHALYGILFRECHQLFNSWYMGDLINHACTGPNCVVI
jgi:hypothetical protein